MNQAKTPKIRVLIRKRPMNKRQLGRNQTDIINVENNQSVVVRQQKLKVDLTPFIDEYRFNFDGAYDEFATNQQIYMTSVRPLVNCAFDGAKVTCFAYGQTGSGKTHTMLGNGANVKGLYVLAAIDIFQQIKNVPQIEAWVSFYEIYCGKLYDLLNQKNILYPRQDAKNNVNIVGLSQTKIQNHQNLMQIIEYGTGIRVTSQNGTNNDSSRSHAILQINLKKKNKLHGKISFIDLAGSQRAADHADQLQKQTRIDGAEINKSLLALKECIRALDQNKNHTPFRGSKLTMVLKDSFTGFCRTVMIGNVSPNSSSSQNTLNTLKYADRVKQLKKPNRQNFLQMQKIDQLQKQLMLPRNISKRSTKKPTEQQDSYKQFRQNINSNIGPNLTKIKVMHNEEQKPINMNNLTDQKTKNFYHPTRSAQTRKNPQQIQNHSSNDQVHNTASHRQSPASHIHRQSPASHIHRQSPASHIHRQSPTSHIHRQSPTSHIHQQSPTSHIHRQSPAPHIPSTKPFHNPFLGNETQEQLTRLSQKHQSYLQLILQEQQSLLKDHQSHINSIIQLTKKQMLIKSQADKIGSRIQEYLERLGDVLDRKLQSVFQLKAKIETIREHIDASKDVEQQYLACSRSFSLFQQQQEEQDDGILDDGDIDQQLFIN